MTEAAQNTITLDFPPHPGTQEYPGGQVAVLLGCLRFRTVTAVFGRAAGKTATVPYLILEEGATIEGTVYEFIYCAPTYKLATEQFQKHLAVFKPILDTSRDYDKGYSKNDLVIQLKPYGKNLGATIRYWGLDNYEDLRGPRAHRIVVDECKNIHRDAVFRVLRPMLLGRSGKWLFIGTPDVKGQGAAWFRSEFQKGQSEDYPNHWSITAPSWCNPWLKDEEKAGMLEDLSDEKDYRQEILAEFLEGEGACFENIHLCFTLKPRQKSRHIWVLDGEEHPKGAEARKPYERTTGAYRYLIGWDIARSPRGDWAVFSVWCLETHEQVYLERRRGVLLSEQIDRVHELRCKYNNATIHYDGNGLGYAMIEELSRRFGEGAVEHQWNHHSKEHDVSNGRLLFHKEQWFFLDVEWQRYEFEVFQIITVSASGLPLKNAKYEAPPGDHDDAVAAALLCSQHFMRSTPVKKQKPAPPPQMTGGYIRNLRKQRAKRKKMAMRNRSTF